MGEYHRAEEKEWKSWVDAECVEVVAPAEARTIKDSIDKRRLIRLRFVYRDKNAGLRTEHTPLPVKAKERLCAQGSNEPLAMAGEVRLDAPTVQRIGIMVFLQLVASFGWHHN
jgi:hypothetical protein